MDEAERLCDRVAIVDHGRVIATGTPRELIARTGAEHIVHCSVAGGTLSVEELRRLPGVLAARTTESGYELQVAAVHAVIPALLAAVQARGLDLTELRTHSPTLEDVFVALTGRELRDG
jgi:ABC-2 type transport system ATP-binding protein